MSIITLHYVTTEELLFASPIINVCIYVCRSPVLLACGECLLIGLVEKICFICRFTRRHNGFPYHQPTHSSQRLHVSIENDVLMMMMMVICRFEDDVDNDDD